MDGRLIRFGEKNRQLLAFVSLSQCGAAVCKNALILVAGLTEGLLSMEYTQLLSKELSSRDYSLVQVNLSSSFMQFGISSLKRDCQELTELVRALKETYSFQKVVLLGHSTGCQDALYYLRHSELASALDGVVLQGAVSDRDILVLEETTPAMLEESVSLIADAKGQKLLSKLFLGAPITAERCHSLMGRLTDDDMFSVDLTEEELRPILSPVKVPILVAFSEQDQYVPDKEKQKEFAERMDRVLRGSSAASVTVRYFTGDHGLTEPRFYEPFVDSVCKFLCEI